MVYLDKIVNSKMKLTSEQKALTLSKQLENIELLKYNVPKKEIKTKEFHVPSEILLRPIIEPIVEQLVQQYLEVQDWKALLLNNDFIKEIVKGMHILPENDKLEVSKGLRNAMSFIHNGRSYRISELMHGGGSGSTPETTDIVFIDNEIVSGTGTNWTLVHIPVLGSLELYGNGQLLTPGIGNDYTISGPFITTANSFTTAALQAFYRNGTGTVTTDTFVDNEVVAGSGTSWTLAFTPTVNSVKLFENGQLLKPGVGNDYQILGSAIITVNSLTAGTVAAQYRKTGVTSQVVTFTDNEIMFGSGNSWTLANTPVLGSVHLYGSGQLLMPGGSNDYTVVGNNIVTTNSFTSGTIVSNYRMT